MTTPATVIPSEVDEMLDRFIEEYNYAKTVITSVECGSTYTRTIHTFVWTYVDIMRTSCLTESKTEAALGALLAWTGSTYGMRRKLDNTTLHAIRRFLENLQRTEKRGRKESPRHVHRRLANRAILLRCIYFLLGKSATL